MTNHMLGLGIFFFALTTWYCTFMALFHYELPTGSCTFMALFHYEPSQPCLTVIYLFSGLLDLFPYTTAQGQTQFTEPNLGPAQEVLR